MKTLKLIEQYMSLLEQDVEETDIDVEGAGVEETDVEVDVEVEEKPPAPGEQAIAELIAAAFAYLPTDEEADIIENIELLQVGTHNEAPPTSDISPRSVIKSVVAHLPVQLRAVYTRGPGLGGITPESEIYLAQILADAFRYRPTPQEAHIAHSVNTEYNDTEPLKVIESIQRLLEFSNESIEDELQDIKIDTE
jgi:hypothetical protein|tara:strand:- start:22 stop:603 length:582 start_codon:yes stop_codon:yes gene_type:complete